VVWEVTDLWFHSMILLSEFGLGVDDVLAEFRRREGVSGIDEKKARRRASDHSVT
jgi:phosphoribosyl-ATP pyrophosphohydrolase